MTKLSLIIPTIGRSTLTRAIESAINQLHEEDEIIVIGDGGEVIPGRLQCEPYLNRKLVYAELPQIVGDYGCSGCDLGISIAKGTHCFFLGDDDLSAEGAFDIIHEGLKDRPELPHLFAMIHCGRRLGNILQACMVSGQQIVVPRNLEKLPKMASEDVHYHMATSDWHFIMRVNAAFGTTVFHDGIIAILEQQNNGRFM